MTKEEPKENHWYEIYELECLRTKELQKQIEIDAKQIRALQKQNGELTDYNKKLLQSDIDKQNKIVLLSKKVNDLQKENAELKDYRLKTLKEQQTGIQKYALNLEHKLNWYDDKLTKAKEIIKNLMVFAEMDDREYEKEYKDAEQFLKEE